MVEGGSFVLLLCLATGLFSCEVSPVSYQEEGERSLSVLSWNVQNLFDEVDDGHEYPEFRSQAQNWNRKTLYSKLEAMADVLKDLPRLPEVMFWQEVESPVLAERFLDRFLKEHDYTHIVGSATPRIQVVMFSRVLLESVETFAIGLSDATGRDFIKVNLTWQGEPLSLVGVHLKSWAGGDSARTRLIRREEFKSLGEWLLPEYQAGRTLLILGDLNRADSESYGSLEDSGFPLRDLVAGREDGTYRRGGKFRWLDGALLSSHLKRDKTIEVELWNHPRLAGEEGEPLRWSTFQRQGVSDHFPFLVHFKVKEKEIH